MADDPKQLPADVRERAIEFMFELNNDPPDHPLTPEKAAGWIDYEIYKQNWRAGRIERREDNSDHPEVGPHSPTGRNVWPHPDSWVGTRDLDANLAIWKALEEVGEDPKTYWGGPAPRGSRTTAPARAPHRSSPSSSPAGGQTPLALVLAAPFLLVGYAIAALFTTIPLYLVLAAVASDYTLVPDTEQELMTAGVILAVLAGWYFISGISKALSSRPA